MHFNWCLGQAYLDLEQYTLNLWVCTHRGVPRAPKRKIGGQLICLITISNSRVKMHLRFAKAY